MNTSEQSIRVGLIWVGGCISFHVYEFVLSNALFIVPRRRAFQSFSLKFIQTLHDPIDKPFFYWFAIEIITQRIDLNHIDSI